MCVCGGGGGGGGYEVSNYSAQLDYVNNAQVLGEEDSHYSTK